MRRWPRGSGGARVAVAALLVVVVAAAVLGGRGGVRGERDYACVRYEPKTCLLGDVEVGARHCRPTGCNFQFGKVGIGYSC